MILFKQYLETLQEIAKKFPETLEFPVIYSHDDEGNEYQRVVNEPVLCQIENPEQKSYRNLEFIGIEDDDDINKKDCNALLIN